jgi:hypothetical protein
MVIHLDVDTHLTKNKTFSFESESKHDVTSGSHCKNAYAFGRVCHAEAEEEAVGKETGLCNVAVVNRVELWELN